MTDVWPPHTIASRAIALNGRGCPVVVGIDGRSASGKTTFADAMADAIRGTGRPVIRASIDDFHRPGHKRRSGREAYTPESYYHQAFDYERFVQWVVDPLMPHGDRRCRVRYWDAAADRTAADEELVAADDAVAVIDGVFLFRAELRDRWDLSIWLDIDFETMIARAVARDVAWVGSPDRVRRRYEERYVPAHRYYEERDTPQDRATLVIERR